MHSTVTEKVTRNGQSSAEVCETIRQAIRAGELLPGMQIRQAEWALRLGVSRVPIREALGMLESEGLLDHEPHQGYFVARLSDGEIQQIYLLRRLLDREIAAALDWPDDEALAELKRIHKMAEAAFEAGDIALWLSCNDRFIMGVYRLCPLQIVVGEATKLWRRTEAVRSGRVRYDWYRLRPEAIRQTIGRILEMLESRNRKGLVSALSRLTKVRKQGAASD